MEKSKKEVQFPERFLLFYPSFTLSLSLPLSTILLPEKAWILRSEEISRGHQ